MPVMLKLVIIVCLSTMSRYECTETNNHSVTRAEELFANPGACLMHGQEMVANLHLVDPFKEYDEVSNKMVTHEVYARIICPRADDGV